MTKGKLIPRHLAEAVKSALSGSRIVNVVGPRQAGKTTLVRQQVPIAEYVTMDDDGMREAMRSDPYGQLRSLADRHRESGLPIVLDEVQRVPQVTLALKRIVDDDRRKGQFILTGSADIFGLNEAGDSLAGRVRTLVLRPLSAAEVTVSHPCGLLDLVEANPKKILSALPRPRAYTRDDAIDLILRGGFPEIRALRDRERTALYQNYIDSVIVKDVPIVAPVRKPDHLRRLVDQLAARTSQELNMAKLCAAVGSRQETVAGWVDTLERICMVHRLPAWASAATKKAIHWPKLHFLDTGCAAALRHETAESFQVGANPTAIGALLETFVHQELEKTLPFCRGSWRLFHWRSDRYEIDLIAEGPGRSLALFEMKASSTVTQDDFKSIDWFLRDGPAQAYAEKAVGFVVYLGASVLTMGPGRVCLPLSMFWSF